MSSNQQPGWFQDPTGEPLQRYWDGSQWTKQVRDFPPPEQAGTSPPHQEEVRPAALAPSPPSGGSPTTRPRRTGIWVAIAALVGVVLLVGGYALNRMQIDESAREAARQGANIGGTQNSLRGITNLLCPEGSSTPPQPGVDCSRADLFD